MNLFYLTIFSFFLIAMPVHAEEKQNFNISTTNTYAFVIAIPTTEEKESHITIENAYAFSTPAGATTGAAFMVIRNEGDVDDELIEAKSDIAEITEIHENMIDPDDGTMMMRRIKHILVPTKEQVVLEPKGKHIMFIKLKNSLKLGSEIPVSLVFKNAGNIDVNIKVITPGSTPESEGLIDDDEDFPEKSFSDEERHF